MTRINVGIEPTNLPDELLLAVRYNLIITCREIKRLPYFKRTLKDQTPPQEFTLGKGHIKFFMTRLRYAKERYKRLKEEAERRGFMVTDFSQNFEGLGEDEEEWKPERMITLKDLKFAPITWKIYRSMSSFEVDDDKIKFSSIFHAQNRS